MPRFVARSCHLQPIALLIATLALIVVTLPVGAQTVVSGTISANTTWTSAGNPYHATGGISVTSGATLTVGAGVIVKFDPGTGIGVSGGSTLDIQGSSGTEVYFTSIKDDAVDGNDTGGDGATSPAARDWTGISFGDTASADIDYLEMRYAGNIKFSHNGYWTYAGILKEGNSGIFDANHLTLMNTGQFGLFVRNSSAANIIDNSTVDATGRVGVYLDNVTNITVQNSTIQSSGEDGLYLADSSGTFSGNTFSNNGQYGVEITGSPCPVSIASNNFSSNANGTAHLIGNASNMSVPATNTLDGPIAVSGTSSAAISWASPSVYKLNGFTIGNGSTLTIPAGQIVKSEQHSLSVASGGTLDVQGTSGSPVYFTSFKDDTVGGDTNGDDSATSPAAQDWAGLSITDGSSADLDYLEMRYAGNIKFSHNSFWTYAGILKEGNSGIFDANHLTLMNTGQFGLFVRNSSAANIINNSTVDATGRAGVYLDNVTNITVQNSTIQNSGEGGLYLINSSGTYSGNTVHNNASEGFYLNGAATTPTITDSTISSNLVGVYCTASANPVIGGSAGSGNDITGNTNYGVQNTTSAITVDATYNWWGDASGPNHPTTNPTGAGDEVSDYVDYGHYTGVSALLDAPELEATPDPLAFGEAVVGSPLVLSTEIENVGASNLDIGTIPAPTGTDAAEFSITDDGCSGETLAPAATCSFDVTFTPTSTGQKTASLDIPSNDPNSPTSVVLTGEGVDCLSQPSGLISWWRGEDFPDDYTGTNDGSVVNSATYADGLVGRAFHVPGSNDYVEVPDDPSLRFDPADPMTIELWVYRTNSAVSQHLLGKRSGCGGGTLNYQIVLDSSAGGICFAANDGSIQRTCSSGGDGDLPLNQWTHLSATSDGTTLRLYIDGDEAASSPGALGPADSAPLRIGTSGDCGASGQGFGGLIDEVRLYDQALSATEVARIYSAGSAGHCADCADRPANMVSWWQGEDDASDFTETNDGADGGVGPAVTYQDGLVGQAFDVTGANDYIEVPDNASLQFATTDPMTIDLWAYRTSSGDNQTIVGKRTNCAGNTFNYQIGFEGSGGVCFAGNDGSVESVCSSGGASDLPLNTWTHIAGTSDGSTLKIYIDGQEAGSVPGNLGTPDTSPFRIGASGDCGVFGVDFQGLIDEVEIHNRALSQSEIEVIYDAGSSGKCQGIDRTPDQFAFMDVTLAEMSTPYSDSFTVAGLEDSAMISIDSCTSTSCEYQINGGGFTSATGLVDNGDTVEVRQTSSAAYSTTTELQLTIGGVSDIFGVTTLDEHQLSITFAGNGSGSISSAPPGIDCTDDCSTMFGETASVTLTPTADTGSSFDGWSGDADCDDGIVSMAVDVACTATFTLEQYTLTVSKTGNGSGLVSSSPGGITCITDCDEIYDYGTAVTLTPAADPGYVFGGWSGQATPADDDCFDGDVVITGDLSCVASFVIPDHLDLFKRNLPDDGNTSQTYAACLSVTAGDEPGGVPPVVVLDGTSVTLHGGYVVKGKNELQTQPTAELIVDASAIPACPTGDCANVDDALVLATEDIEAENDTCVAGCPTDDTHDSCVASCLEGSIVLGSACAACFGTYDECVLTNCPDSGICAAPSSDACLACKENNCNPAFLACAGFTLLPF